MANQNAIKATRLYKPSFNHYMVDNRDDFPQTI